MLWDLIHDRAHSRGDLPFDPFMIRQRMPFWMYSLEELRCDLTAFCEAVTLEQEGNAAARDVQYAIFFDRAFRFPLTGPRVRNYDGLGGQLLFAYLHRAGVLRWTDNRLTIDWDGLAGAVAALRSEVEKLYREGIDCFSRAGWASAHDLVADLRPRRQRGEGRPRAERRGDPRRFIDQVQPDEFLFSAPTLLQAKLAETVEPRWCGLIAVGAAGALGQAVVDQQDGTRSAPSQAPGGPARRAGDAGLGRPLGEVDGLIHLVGGWKGGTDPESTAWLHDQLVVTLKRHRAFLEPPSAPAGRRDGVVQAGRASIVGQRRLRRREGRGRGVDVALSDEITANVVAVNAIVTPEMRAEKPDAKFATFTDVADIADAIALLLRANVNRQRIALYKD